MVPAWFEKIWRVLYLFEEDQWSPALLKVHIHSTELNEQFLLEKYFVKWTKVLAVIAFFYIKLVNLTILWQQLQLFIMYSRFFWRAIVDIGFRKGWLLEQLLSPNSRSFGVLSLDFKLISRYCTSCEHLLFVNTFCDLFEASNVGKDNRLFKKKQLQSSSCSHL